MKRVGPSSGSQKEEGSWVPMSTPQCPPVGTSASGLRLPPTHRGSPSPSVLTEPHKTADVLGAAGPGWVVSCGQLTSPFRFLTVGSEGPWCFGKGT